MLGFTVALTLFLEVFKELAHCDTHLRLCSLQQSTFFDIVTGDFVQRGL